MSGNDSYRCPGCELCGAALTASSPRSAAPDTTGGELRDSNDVAVEDVREVAVALGLGGHARPYSAHDVVQRQVLPALRDLLAERDKLAAQVRAVEGLTYASDDGSEYEHDHGIGDGHDECPACWVEDIRRALGTPTTGGGE